MANEKLLRPQAAAELLGLSRRTLRRYEAQGKIEAVKLNSRVTRYRESDVLALQSGEKITPLPLPPTPATKPRRPVQLKRAA